MALKDYNTSELQAEITRRAHRCPICATLQVQLDEVSGALGTSMVGETTSLPKAREEH